MPGSFHLSFFVFRQFCKGSYQNQLSFSGKDSTADFFIFRHFDEKQKTKDEMNLAITVKHQFRIDMVDYLIQKFEL